MPTSDDDPRCEVCEYITHASKVFIDEHADERAELTAGAAYVDGLARGFNIRTESTFIAMCTKHRDAMTSALNREGSLVLNHTPPNERS